MTGYVQFALLVAGAAILILVILDSIFKRRGNKIVPIPVVTEHAANHSFQGEANDSNDGAQTCIHLPPETQHVAATQPVEVAQDEVAEDLLMLSVVAKPNNYFGSYDLLQAISATGMQFGHMNLFHYYSSTLTGRAVLFSLASATEQGGFNLDKMGDFSCAGLILFMKPHQVPDAEEAFDLMLDAAKQLADDLEGELRAGPRQPLTDAVLQSYRDKLRTI
jgi:cell division protein ZipA